jgi:Astacin (Peptidase family M12A)
MSGQVSVTNQGNMTSAMKVIQDVANVQFQQCKNNSCSGAYVHIRDSTNDTIAGKDNQCQNNARNDSHVGKQGGKQTIDIVNWNIRFKLVHELLHTLGFVHEQTSPLRDTYVDVATFCANVQGGCAGDTYKNNFPRDTTAAAYGYYDFDSVMHYGQCYFSSNPNCPTIPPPPPPGFPPPPYPDGGVTIKVKPPYDKQLAPDGKTPWPAAIGQRDHLSAADQATVSFLYPFATWRFLYTAYDGHNGASDGTFLKPYTTWAKAIANTPAGGTLWLLEWDSKGVIQSIPAVGTYKQQITIRTAPRVSASLGR